MYAVRTVTLLQDRALSPGVEPAAQNLNSTLEQGGQSFNNQLLI